MPLLKTRTCTIRYQNVWYTDDVRQQKRKVQKSEKLWRRSKDNHHWKKWREEQKIYHQLIRRTKIEKLSEKVNDCKGNIKELYKFFNSVTGTKTTNPMPQREDDTGLAEEFADFFLDKIKNIRTALDHLPNFVPQHKDTSVFSKFDSLTQSEVKNIIMSMGSKSCELDCMPTSILKAVLPHVLPIITDIIID